jgi:hypothetical protein
VLAPVIAITAGVAYTLVEGDGNPIDGLQLIGRGDDPLSQALEKGTAVAVSLSMQQYPQETRAVLNLLASTGEAIEATVRYLDEKSGQRVSRQWNQLSPETRNTLIGAGKVTSLVLPAASVGQIKNRIASFNRIEKIPEPAGESMFGKWIKSFWGTTPKPSTDILGSSSKDLVGVKYKGAGEYIRTVSKEKFAEIKSDLMEGAMPTEKYTKTRKVKVNGESTKTKEIVEGQWYQREDGLVFRIRNSKSGEVIDIRNTKGMPPHLKSLKIRQE